MSARRLLLVGLVALVARLVVIGLYPGGGYDLRIYEHFGQVVLDGRNPYTDSGDPLSIYGDNQPAEMLLFAALQSINGFRLFFALAETLAVVLVARLVSPAAGWFLAGAPYVLWASTAITEDKGLILLLVALLVYGVRSSVRIGWVAAFVLFAVKWVGLFVAPVLLVHTWRVAGRRAALRWSAWFAVVVGVSELPWFPESLRAIERRNDRVAMPPSFDSWTRLLGGMYDPSLARLLTVGALAAVFVAFWRHWLSADAAVVLALFAAFWALPDQDYTRIAAITVPLVLVLRLSGRQWWLLGAASSVAAAVYAAVSLPDGRSTLLTTFVFNALAAAVAVAVVWQARGDGEGAVARRAARRSGAAPTLGQV